MNQVNKETNAAASEEPKTVKTGDMQVANNARNSLPNGINDVSEDLGKIKIAEW